MMANKFYSAGAGVTIGGDVRDIVSFEFSVPAGQIGSRLSCEFARHDQPVNSGGEVSFEILISGSGGSDSAVLLEDGQIIDESVSTATATDSVRISVLSKLARKWRLTPRRPVTLYDPERVNIASEATASRNDVIDEQGAAIEPEQIEVASLDLGQILRFAYVDRCGFGQVITNIPNYPVQRADFPLTSPYHATPASLVGLFEPEYTSESVALISIVDPQGALPVGFPAQTRPTALSSYLQFERVKQAAPLVNAVLLTFRDNTFSEDTAGSVTDRVDQEIQEVGTFGEAGWQRTVFNRFIKEFHDDPDNPGRITREIIWKVESRASARADGIVREISIETQTDTYDYDFRLKTGYTKIISLYTALPGQGALMRQVQTETNRIIWEVSSSNPGNLIKAWETTEVIGTILIEGDPDDPDSKVSLYEANRTNSITDDQEAQLAKPITTIIERWREIGPDQIEVTYQKIDHLAERPEQTKTVQHTGTVTARLGLRDNATRRTMLIRDEESEAVEGALPPATLDAGEIPLPEALELAGRILARRGQAPQRVSIALAGLDLSMRRGSLRRVADRSGQEYLVFITGYSITGQNLGADAAEISHTAEGIILEEIEEES